MVTSPPRPAHDAAAVSQAHGVVVRPPRDADGIGVALRDCYDGSARMPEEFCGYLQRIDGAARR